MHSMIPVLWRNFDGRNGGFLRSSAAASQFKPLNNSRRLISSNVARSLSSNARHALKKGSNTRGTCLSSSLIHLYVTASDFLSVMYLLILPTVINHMVWPRLQISAFIDILRRYLISGALNNSVPLKSSCVGLPSQRVRSKAQSKSVIIKWPDLASKIFRGLISRCTMLKECRCSKPHITSLQ